MRGYKRATVELVLLLTSQAVIGGAIHVQEPLIVEKARAVQKICVKDSVTYEQATQIINLYLDYVVRSHCLPPAVREGNDSWYCFPDKDDDCHPDSVRILVNKKTGGISWGRGPGYLSPRAFAQAVIQNPSGPLKMKE